MHDEIAEGQVLAGKYRVERVLGVGGMGVVVAAHHLQLDERVAIKTQSLDRRWGLQHGQAHPRLPPSHPPPRSPPRRPCPPRNPRQPRRAPATCSTIGSKIWQIWL